jgi:tetratricopeptide (TPR) repeat protein
MAELKKLIDEHTTRGKKPPLSIFGHADPVGDDDYNKKLSGRRAAAIYALIARRPDIWEDIFKNKGKFADPLSHDEHPATVRALSSLAQTQTTLGDYNEAVSIYQRLLAVQDKTLGTDSPEVAATMSKLAFAFRKTGRKSEAQALEDRSKALLADH